MKVSKINKKAGTHPKRALLPFCHPTLGLQKCRGWEELWEVSVCIDTPFDEEPFLEALASCPPQCPLGSGCLRTNLQNPLRLKRVQWEGQRAGIEAKSLTYMNP